MKILAKKSTGRPGAPSETRHQSPEGFTRTRQRQQRDGYRIAAFGWEGGEFVVHWRTSVMKGSNDNGND